MCAVSTLPALTWTALMNAGNPLWQGRRSLSPFHSPPSPSLYTSSFPFQCMPSPCKPPFSPVEIVQRPPRSDVFEGMLSWQYIECILRIAPAAFCWLYFLREMQQCATCMPMDCLRLPVYFLQQPASHAGWHPWPGLQRCRGARPGSRLNRTSSARYAFVVQCA